MRTFVRVTEESYGAARASECFNSVAFHYLWFVCSSYISHGAQYSLKFKRSISALGLLEVRLL